MAVFTSGRAADLPQSQIKAKPQMQFGSERCVVLLHGLARTWRSMRPVGNALQRSGWHVVNQDYPSRQASVEELSSKVGEAFELCQKKGFDYKQIDVVTHSMGGILLRHWVKTTGVDFGRAVMLGPPNAGSELVDRIGDTTLFKAYNGPAGGQLGTDENAVWRRLPAVDFELGVIAGSGEEGGLLGRHVAAPNDGKVSVASTRVAGMKDHIVMQVDHTFMMNNATVHQQIQTFLEHGQFGADVAGKP